jgi:hypothetical protein
MAVVVVVLVIMIRHKHVEFLVTTDSNVIFYQYLKTALI